MRRTAFVAVVVIAAAAAGLPGRPGDSSGAQFRRATTLHLQGAPHADPLARRDPAPMTMTMTAGISAPEHGGFLPPGTRHGLAHRLRQYPALSLASPAQRRAAVSLWRRFGERTRRWTNPRAAARDGFDLRRARRAPGEDRPMWLHSKNRAWHADRVFLDVKRPDTLIYLDLPHRRLRLVGVMISMPRGQRAPTPGGPITRWHHHLVCVDHGRRGVAPREDGSCSPNAVLGQGSEMMHVWFTRDLRSAFAIHAPVPEMCTAKLLPPAYCDGRAISGM